MATQTFRIELGSGSAKRKAPIGMRQRQAESIQQTLQNIPVCHKETFLQTFLFIHSEKSSISTFRFSFWRLGVKVPVAGDVQLSQEQEVHPDTSYK